MLKAVIFDMDGVIVDTEPLHRKAYQLMFDVVDIHVTKKLYESFTGQSTINICKALVTKFNLSDTPENLVAIKRQFFQELFETDKDLQLIDGVLDCINNYVNNGLLLVLASSASMDTIDNVFKRFHLESFFYTKLSGAELTVSKPHPEIFIKAAQSISCDINECIVIEDSTNGIKAAKAANIYCIGFKSPNSKNQNYQLADLVIDDFKNVTYDNIITLI